MVSEPLQGYPSRMTRIWALLLVIAVALPMGAEVVAGGVQAEASPTPSDKYSGMYSFLRDGEFVQITVEDQGKVTGFVSRFGELDSDKGAFLDQFFKEGKLDGSKLTFTTQPVHGVWFAFDGIVDRGEGKNPGDEAYYILKGTLTEYRTDDKQKSSSRARQVAFKSFPQDMAPSSPTHD
jgi:hypothetical protein